MYHSLFIHSPTVKETLSFSLPMKEKTHLLCLSFCISPVLLTPNTSLLTPLVTKRVEVFPHDNEQIPNTSWVNRRCHGTSQDSALINAGSKMRFKRKTRGSRGGNITEQLNIYV